MYDSITRLLQADVSPTIFTLNISSIKKRDVIMGWAGARDVEMGDTICQTPPLRLEGYLHPSLLPIVEVTSVTMYYPSISMSNLPIPIFS